MFLDGLEDAYDKGRLMGTFAEDCAGTFGFTRQAQDDYALRSLARAQQAIAEGWFADEIVPVRLAQKKGDDLVIDFDESVREVPSTSTSMVS